MTDPGDRLGTPSTLDYPDLLVFDGPGFADSPANPAACRYGSSGDHAIDGCSPKPVGRFVTDQ